MVRRWRATATKTHISRGFHQHRIDLHSSSPRARFVNGEADRIAPSRRPRATTFQRLKTRLGRIHSSAPQSRNETAHGNPIETANPEIAVPSPAVGSEQPAAEQAR